MVCLREIDYNIPMARLPLVYLAALLGLAGCTTTPYPTPIAKTGQARAQPQAAKGNFKTDYHYPPAPTGAYRSELSASVALFIDGTQSGGYNLAKGGWYPKTSPEIITRATVDDLKASGIFTSVTYAADDQGDADIRVSGTIVEAVVRDSFMTSNYSIHINFQVTRLSDNAMVWSGTLAGRKSISFFAAFAMPRGPIDTILRSIYTQLRNQLATNLPRIAAQPERVASAPRGPRAKKKRYRRSDVDKGWPKLPERPDDFALIVGIEDYRTLPAADYGEHDADTMQKYLMGMGVPEENIILLKGARASKTDLAKYLEEWLPRNVLPESRVYFYYSGHGAPEPSSGKAYLVPYDGDPSFLKSSAYPVSRLYKNLQKLKAKEVIVMLDACFSGAGGRSVIAKGTRPLVTIKNPTLRRGSKVVALTASSGSEIAGGLDKKSHGMFTYYLLKGLQGAADADGNSHVTLRELHGYVRKRVQRAARRQNREQTPQIDAAKDLNFY